MQALVYTDTQTLTYREEKNPKQINGESIIKVTASGICGSDMHAYHGKDNRRIPPLILGHEVSGVIDKGKEVGKKVVLNPLITCGKCDHCKSGKEHLCNKRIILGMNKPIERQGGFAEYVSIPDKNIYELPKNLLGKIWKGKYRGQKQKWFVMKFTGKDEEINVNTKNPEFLSWKWIKISELTNIAVSFKLEVYKKLQEKLNSLNLN